MADNPSYIVSARKYRPATFASVVGQGNLTSTLKNAIDTRRLAQAYLFTGPRGVGKTSCARIFAKTINCESPTADGEACGHCESCVAMERGNSFNVIELDAASNNSVDDIRALTEQVSIPPQSGRYRVFIIDEVHMLSTAAFNAFLKTLEEPPSYVIFILATTEKHKVIPTILSRCQIYDFKRITVDDMASHLAYVARQEGITAAPDALNVIARKADGAMRDALSIFDQVAASTMGNLTYEATIANLNVLDYDYYFRLVEAFRTADVAEALLVYKQIRDKGFDSLFFVNGLASHVRDLMVAADRRTLPLLEAAHEVAERYSQQASSLPLPWYYTALRLLSECDLNYRTATDKRLLVEIALIRLCQLLNPPQPPYDAVDATPALKAPVQPAGAKPSEPSPAVQAPRVPPGAPAPPSAAASPVQGQPAVSSDPQAAYAHAATQTAPPAQTASSQTAAPAQPVARPRPSTIRLSAVSEAPASAALQQRAEPFTPEAFESAWQQFIAGHPSLHILCTAMRTAAKAQAGPTEWRITVGHPAQKQSFETSMPQLVAFMRERLRNDLLTLSVDVSEAPVAERRMPQQEFLKMVVDHNPAAAQFFRDTDAEIG